MLDFGINCWKNGKELGSWKTVTSYFRWKVIGRSSGGTFDASILLVHCFLWQDRFANQKADLILATLEEFEERMIRWSFKFIWKIEMCSKYKSSSWELLLLDFRVTCTGRTGSQCTCLRWDSVREYPREWYSECSSSAYRCGTCTGEQNIRWIHWSCSLILPPLVRFVRELVWLNL